MLPIPFWKTWPIQYQRLFWIIGPCCLFAIAFLWVSNFRSPAPVFTPDHFQELEAQEIPLRQFQQGTTPHTITAENYVITEHVLGSALKPNGTASYLFLALLLAGIVLLLSVLTTLTRFWFYMGMGLFILLVVSFRLDSLKLFGVAGKVPVAVLLLVYAFAGYFFQFLRPSSSFIKRVAVFSIITVLTGVAIVYTTRVPQPLHFLSANGLIAGTIFTILFIFTVAHEIIASFVAVLTRGRKPTKSLQHFLIVTAIYMINLGLNYAHKKHLIGWDFLPVNLFLLVTISGILGLWGFRHREPLYESFMRADPFGTYFFLALAGIGFGTMGYFLATANDPAIQILEDAILYSHLGYGLIFFIYTISNFISLLGNNLQVYKVLYKPTTMPYFTFRFAGLIATFTFFAYSNWQVSVNQVYAGYYNALGDFHLSQDSLLPAEDFYRRSVFFATRNYHAHYALAEFDASRWDFSKEKQELQKLADGRPLDLAYLNYSRIHEITNSWQEAVKILKAGLIDFPENGLLQNALGLAYAKLGREDSAFMMINAARKSSISRAAAETNLMGLSARFRVAYPADSLMELFNAGNPGVQSNALALASLQGKPIEFQIDPGEDTVFTVYSATAINNYLLSHLDRVDSALISKIVRLARKPSNSNFKNMLLAAAAHTYYANGQITRAFRYMHEIAFLGQQPKYYSALGLWAMEQGSPEKAVQYFDEASRKNFKGASFNRALALAEARDFPRAIHALDSLGRFGDPDIQKEAKETAAGLARSIPEAFALSDEEKYEFSRHHFPVSREEEFAKFIASIADPGVKVRAIVDRSKKLEEADEAEMTIRTLELAKGLRFSDKGVYDEIRHRTLRCLARAGQWPMVQQEMKKEIKFEGIYRQDKLYFDALLNALAGKKEEAAKNFEWLATANPFFEDAVVAAAAFAAENDEDKIKPYTILVNALDLNPNSVKLLKAYFVQAAHLDFDEPAKETLDKLHHLLRPEAFIQFVKENPDIFEITVN